MSASAHGSRPARAGEETSEPISKGKIHTAPRAPDVRRRADLITGDTLLTRGVIMWRLFRLHIQNRQQAALLFARRSSDRASRQHPQARVMTQRGRDPMWLHHAPHASTHYARPSGTPAR